MIKSNIYYFDRSVGYKTLSDCKDEEFSEILVFNKDLDTDNREYGKSYLYNSHTFFNTYTLGYLEFYYYPTKMDQEKVISILNSPDLETRLLIKSILENEH